MLDKYTPDLYASSDIEYIREVYIDALGDAIHHRGRLNHADGHYYAIEDIHGDVQHSLAATTIADAIDYETLDEDHPYHHTHDAAGHHPSDWPHIRWYSQKRGALLHEHILRRANDEGWNYRERAHNLLQYPPNDATIEDVQETISNWQHAPEVPHPDDDVLGEAEYALAERMQFECDGAARNWDILTESWDSLRIRDEALTNGETRTGHVYGCQIDRVTAVKEANIPPGVYAVELKLADEWHPRHLVQAEAQRRTLLEYIPDAEGAVARLGVEEGDYELITTADEEWDSELLWDMFCRRAKGMYSDSRYQMALKNSGR